MSQLSSVVRFLVISCTPPAKEAVVVKRKKGYVSFLQESNAAKMAARLAKKNPGTRFYVTRLIGGHFIPATPTLTSRSY